MYNSGLFIFKFLFLIVPVLISVAFFTLLERKILSLVGMRVGPNKVYFMGILQPIMDAVKLSNKQVNSLSNSYFFFYYLSAFLLIFSSLSLWEMVFLNPCPSSIKFSILFLMLILSVNSFNSVISGWSTFGKYSLIGSLRTVTQLVSYEASLYLCLFFFIGAFCSFSINSISFFPFFYFSLFFPVVLYIWVPSFLAELNRTPYDFSEGESELVSGFNTEFGSAGFTLIFLAEYANIIFFSLLTSFLFFIGGSFYFFFFIFFFVIWIRSVLPRFRFDKLMMLAWKFFIPFLTLFFMFFLMFLY